jgi:hypothetical protein
VTTLAAAPLHIGIGRRQIRKAQWNRTQIAARRSEPDTLVSPPSCPSDFIELLSVQRMEWVDYLEFPGGAIFLGCSLLYCRSAFICGSIDFYG